MASRLSWDTLGEDGWERWHPDAQLGENLTAEESDNPVTGQLWAADGETLLAVLYERRPVKFGYQK